MCLILTPVKSLRTILINFKFCSLIPPVHKLHRKTNLNNSVVSDISGKIGEKTKILFGILKSDISLNLFEIAMCDNYTWF